MGNTGEYNNYFSPQSLGSGNSTVEMKTLLAQVQARYDLETSASKKQITQYVGELAREQREHSQTKMALQRTNAAYSELEKKLQTVLNEYSKLKAENERLAMNLKDEQREHKKKGVENEQLNQKWQSALTERNDLSTKIGLLQHENENLKKEKRDLEDKLNRTGSAHSVATDRNGPIPATDRVISEFNAWAANPTARLPSNFQYITGDMQIRTEQTLLMSNVETQWIVNNTGKKYLFPNPCLFDGLTNISKFYKMDAAGLKAKGQNRLRIKKPCEMSDKGWIEYPGELELL
jgi:regulator of replication initiation timing